MGRFFMENSLLRHLFNMYLKCLTGTLLALIVGITGAAQNAGLRPPYPPKNAFRLIRDAKPGHLRSAADNEYIVGLFSSDGRLLLGTHYYNIGNYDTGVALQDGVIFLMDTNRTRYQRSGISVLPGYEVKAGAYTRDGLLLYEPFWFDNGPDYFEEGRQRFVYGNKMGFVNRFAEVTVPARYPFVTPYRHGYALACLDCVYTRVDSADLEHGTQFVGNNWVVIDKRGRETAAHHGSPGSISADSAGPVIRPTAKVLALGQIILADSTVQREVKAYGATVDQLKPVCYDMPSLQSPWYHISFELDGDSFMGGAFQFLIAADGKRIRHLNSDLQRSESMEAWKTYLDNISEE